MAAPKLARDRVAALASEIQAYCAAHADADKALKWTRYFKEGYEAWGIIDKDDPFFNERQAEWLEKNGSLGLRGFLRLGTLLFASGKYEEGAIAIRFVKELRDQFDSATFALLGQWFEGVRNWAHTDVLCGEVISPLLQGGVIPLEAVASWRASPHKFQRRAVPVAMLGLLKTDTAIM
ncbi:MAG TPA: DNA alkylation repair protein, partial [Bryobacteraceae bacterium]|nr:DNA alkylation repair protein [Bryobacteraceae bacterium]